MILELCYNFKKNNLGDTYMTNSTNNKKQKGNLDFMEALRREAEERRLKYNIEKKEVVEEVVEEVEVVVDEKNENVKPNKKYTNNLKDEKFDYYYSSEEETSSSKRIVIGMFTVGAVALIGYLGFDYSQNNQKTAENSIIVATDKVKETNITSPKEQDKIVTTSTHNTTINSVKGELENRKRESVAKTEPSVTTEEEKKIIATIVKSMNQRKISDDKSIKETAPVETIKKLPKIVKVEKKIEKKEIVKHKIEKKKRIKKEVIKKKIVKKNIVKKKPKVVKPRVVIIKKGDTLASIANRFYGNPMEYKRIIRANHNIRSASTPLRLGQKIIVPGVENEKKRRVVVVKKGDTLAIISKRFYGDSRKFQKIIDANYKIKNANSRLSIGQKIYVPR
jgi:nucleoid-associated protein YgaU